MVIYISHTLQAFEILKFTILHLHSFFIWLDAMFNWQISCKFLDCDTVFKE